MELYQDSKGPGKEIVSVALNIGRIVGNMVFTLDDDQSLNPAVQLGSENEEKSTSWTKNGVFPIFLGVIVLFFLTLYLFYNRKISALFKDKRTSAQSP